MREWCACAVLFAVVAGCVDSNAKICGDGRVCPDTSVCDNIHELCVLADQLTSCDGLAERADCPLPGGKTGLCRDGVCLQPGCGDALVEGAEQCDGKLSDEQDDCTEHSFYSGGKVACTDQCTFDTTACTGYCGDGSVNGNEACDPQDATLDGKTCRSFGYYVDGSLGCSAACTFDTSGCSDYCGDGIVNGQEDCDGDAFGGANCTTAGFYYPTGLRCSSGCRFDTALCTGRCGDGVLDPGEDCDGAMLASKTCMDFGYYNANTLACTDACTFDVSQCTGFCGDRASQGAEVCDGDAPGSSCTDFGFDFGPVGCSALCAPDLSACRAPSQDAWAALPAPPLSMGLDIWGAANGNLFVAGCTGTVTCVGAVSRWNGSTWTNTTFAGTTMMRAVWGTSATDVFVAGENGTISHFNGATWTTTTPTAQTINALWGTGSNDVYAGGVGGTLLHYASGTWSPVTGTGLTTSDVMGIWGASATNIYFVTASEIYHLNGTWSKQTFAGTAMFGIYGTGPKDVFAFGDNGLLRHDTGAGWQTEQLPTTQQLFHAWGSGPGDVYVVGGAGTIVHYDGLTWSAMVSASSSYWMYGVWGRDAGDVYAVGNSGFLQHFSREGWTIQRTGTSANITKVWSRAPGQVVMVGSNEIREYPSGAVTYASDTMRGVGGNATEVFAVGYTGTIYRKDPSLGWQQQTSPTTNWLLAVTSPTTGTAFAVGLAGTIVKYNGSTWTTMASGTSQALSGVWAPSATEAFAVGGLGTILHLAGGTWTAMSSPVSSDLTGVWGTSAKDVFAVGNLGVILHYDGTTWRTMESRTTASFRSVGGRGPGDVFASGDSGTALHYDGIAWSETAPKLAGLLDGASGTFISPASGDYLLEWRRSCAATETTCNDGRDDDCDGLFDCGDPNCSANQFCVGGGLCAGATALQCGVPKPAETTVGGSLGISYYACDDVAEHGREKTYTISRATTGPITLTLAAAKDLDLIVTASGSGGGCEIRNPGCIAASSHAGGNETITFTATANATYYVIVDGFGAAQSPFSISATCP